MIEKENEAYSAFTARHFGKEPLCHEIKKKRPQRAPLVAQLTRYANCPQIARLIVLAPRGVDLPKSIGGKPVTMMSLEKLWGIMLP